MKRLRMPDFPYLSVIIPTFGPIGVPLTQKCVETLRAQHEHLGSESIEITIVEDSQDEGVLAGLYEKVAKPFSCRLFSQPNGGFAKACNRGLRESNGEVCFLVNNDIEFIEPTLQVLDDVMHSTGSWIVGCRLLYPNSTVQHGGVVWVPAKDAPVPGYFDHVARFLHRLHPIAYAMRVSLVTGALYGISRVALEVVGYLDERYGMALEDIDYALEVIQAGGKPLYCGYTCAIHHEGKTRGRTLEEKMKLAPGKWELEQQALEKFYEKWVGVPWAMFDIHHNLGYELDSARNK
jgi:GT2 family glycosyltransferase